MNQEFHARALAGLAEALRVAPHPARTAEQVVSFAQNQLDADYSGITLVRRGGRLETIASTHSVVAEIDALQDELADGPSRDDGWQQGMLLCPDLSADERWPQWAPKAAAHGIAAVLSVELVNLDGRRIGAVNSYWGAPREFSRDNLAFASLFARHAAIALVASLEVANLNVALDTRKRIGQAQGILMAYYDLDEERAFEVLRRYSQDYNVKLREIADQIVTHRRLPQLTGDDPE